MFWKWLTIFGLAAAPALVLGQSVAWAAGFRMGMNIGALGVVITLGGFSEGLVIAMLAELPRHAARFQRWLDKLNDPTSANLARRWRAARWLAKRGPWPGLLLGTAFLGQEPMIVFFVWVGIPIRRLALPILVTNVLYTVIFAITVKLGLNDWDQLSKLF